MLHFYYSKQPSTFRKEIQKFEKAFAEHRRSVAEKAFTKLPWENGNTLLNIQYEFLKSKKKPFKTFVIIGMGGSSLGMKALTQALDKHSVMYLNNVDPDFIHGQLSRISFRKSLFFLISKSGETTEVLTLTQLLLSEKISPEHFFIITDEKKSALGRIAQKFKIPLIVSPHNISGRFSILSTVSMLPAAFLQIPIQKILRGARQALWQEAYRLACHQYMHFREKKNIVVLFPYTEGLSAFSNWYIQLLAESIGKSKTVGITPIKAMGVKDQHAQLQLFLDGPDDKFYIFLKPERFQHDFSLPGKTYKLSTLFHSEYEGVKKSFIRMEKPFLEITFQRLDSSTLGELFFFFELEVAFLGSLFGINIENQPKVEESKKITKNLLKKM